MPPPPLQLLSSASSDYLSTSTTLHQHTQTHSTRLVAVTTDAKRKIPLPIPATTLIKIETDATTLDQTKTLQAVSTIASNTGTVFTDQNMTPLVTTHVIYQHPTNLILSQTPAAETACRSQGTSPVACLTPPPEALPVSEDEPPGVQDASNQTDTPICSEDDNTTHAISDVVGEAKIKFSESEMLTLPMIQPIKITELIEPPKTVGIEPPLVKEQTTEPSPPKSTVIPQKDIEEQREVLKPDLSGLELLSNSIVEFECCQNIKVVKEEDKPIAIPKEPEQNADVLNKIAHMTLKDSEIESLPVPVITASKTVDDTLGGLDLLCALAEQRIMEEGRNKKPSEYPDVSQNNEKDRNWERHRRKEKRKSKKHTDEPRHKKIKVNGENKRQERKENIDAEMTKLSILERNISTMEESKKSENSCNCRDDNYRTYKTRESEEEVKKFIASKSQSLCCKGDWPCMNAMELEMRMRLADLQRKYKEKQRELSKLKSKKHSEHKEKKRSRKKSVTSDRSTPPPVLDKMDVPVKPNKNTIELLRPPTLCAFGGQEAAKLPDPIKDSDIQKPEKVETHKKRHSQDLIDERSSSKKRKVGRPKKLTSSPGLQVTTETIVAKKPKKNLVGYLLAAKEKLLQNRNDFIFSNSPPRYIDETIKKHKSHKNKSKDGKKEHKKKDKCKIRPKLKAEPTVKTYVEEEEVNEWHSKEEEPACNYEEPVETTQESDFAVHEIEEQKTEEEPEEEPKPTDLRCILTAEHLETDKLRVLTAMGGLFYAGQLNAVEPPDVYSITLDGERGNRPHIMSREEILRDAVSIIFNKIPRTTFVSGNAIA